MAKSLKKINFSKITKLAAVVICVHLLYVLSVIISVCIPTASYEENLNKAALEIQAEGLYPTHFSLNHQMIKWDNWTSAITINIISRDEKASIFDKAIMNYMGGYSETATDPIDAMIDQVNGKNLPATAYSRYWGGCVVLVKMLLIFMGLMPIRVILANVGFALLLMLYFKLKNYTSKTIAMIFFLFYFFSGMYVNMMCVTFFAEILVTLLVLLMMFNNKNNIEEKHLWEFFFLITGSFTMYFCWYSYPMLTLCLPLMYLISTSKPINSENKIKEISRLIILSIWWCIGYLCTAMVKSVLCLMIQTEQTTTDEMGAIVGDLSLSNIPWRFGAVWQKIQIYFNIPILGLFIIILFLIAIMNMRSKKKFLPSKCDRNKVTGYMLVGLYPIVWIFFTAAHAYIHGVDSFILCISCLAIFMIENECFVGIEESEMCNG